jgi:hypothetical protein
MTTVCHLIEILAVEAFAAFLQGRLEPVNAEAEIAVQDLVEQTDRDARAALQAFYALAGRPSVSARR